MSTSFILNPHRFGAAADPGLTLLQGATLWLDASDDIANSQWIRNKGTGGRSLDAREGSVGSAQIVKGALKLPGSGANYASAPDLAAYDVAGSGEWILRVSALDWTPTSSQTFFSRFHSGSTVQPFFYLNTGGTLGLDWVDAGAVYRGNTSTAAVSFTDGQAGWVRVTYDGANVKFYTAADQAAVPTSWTQLGSDVARTQNPAAGTAPIFVGCLASNSQTFNGSIFHARLIVGGTVVFDADFTAVSDLATSFTESSSNAATVTINSTTGVDTNDPLLLTHTGTNFLYGSGTSVPASVPSSAAYSTLTGDIEIVARLHMTDWTPSARSAIVMRRSGGVSSDDAFGLAVNTDGTLYYFGCHAGPVLNQVNSSVATGFTDGSTNWVKMTRTQSSGTVRFYTAADQATEPSSWTQLGTDRTGNSTLSLNTGSMPIGIGGYGAGGTNMLSPNEPLTGGLFRVIVRDSIGGTAVFDADFTANTNQSSFTESSSNAATVTINRATSGRKAAMVTRPVWLFGTDDYMEIADNALLNFNNESLTAVVVHRGFGTPGGAYYHILTKEGGSVYEGWSIINEATARAPRFHVGDGTNNATNNTAIPTLTAGQLTLSGGVWNESDGTAKTYNGSTLIDSDTSTPGAMGNISSTLPLRIARPAYASPAVYIDGEIIAVAVFRSALTSTELGQIATYYGV